MSEREKESADSVELSEEDQPEGDTQNEEKTSHMSGINPASLTVSGECYRRCVSEVVVFLPYKAS